MVIWLLLLGCPIVTEADQDAVRDRDGDGHDAVAFGGADCDDEDPQVNPAAEEVWYDGVDDDCDGNDNDRDGDGVPGGDVGSDCDDDNPEVVDTRTFFLDRDGDGFGSPSSPLSGGCEPLVGQSDNDLDCDDTNAAIHPDASEVCDDNNVDEDCDDLADDLDDVGPEPGNQSFFYVDADGDGFGVGEALLLCDGGDGFADVDEDCDDTNAELVPGSPWYLDRDRDGWGSDEDVVTACLPLIGRVLRGGDCADRNPEVHPGVLDDPPNDFVDADCAGDTDAEQTATGLPLPIALWSVSPDWTVAPRTCPSHTPSERHVGPGELYISIQQAIDAADPCDIVAVHGGSYAPFVVDKHGVVVTAMPGEEVIIWSGTGILVSAPDVILADLTVEEATSALNLEQSAFLDRMRLQDNIGNITATGDLLVYDLDVDGGIGGITQTGAGNLRIARASFDEVLGIFGVIHHSLLGTPLLGEGGIVELAAVEILESTGGLAAALDLHAPSAALIGISVHGGAGAAIWVDADVVVGDGIGVVESTVYDQPMIWARGDTVVFLRDVVAFDNSWVLTDDDFFGARAFVELEGYATSFVDQVGLASNFVDADRAPNTRPIWLRSWSGLASTPSTHTAHHVLVSAYDPYGLGGATGVGILFEGGDIRQATLVGLDVGVWSVEGTLGAGSVSDSIVWDVDELVLTDEDWFFRSGVPLDATVDIATNHPDCPSCPNDNPEFLRYHPKLDGALWDLRLRRIPEPSSPDVTSPYYDFGSADAHPAATCTFTDIDVGTAVDGQLGAYGNHGLTVELVEDVFSSELFPAESLLTDGFAYNDCDLDGAYDTWEGEFVAFDPGADPDGDSLDNEEEFALGTLPDVADTDGDGTTDGLDSAPLDPTVP